MTDQQHSNVEQQIAQGNPWYVSSQFEWAENKAVRRIYQRRFDYFKTIVEREVAKKDRVTVLDYGCGDGYWSMRLSQIAHCQVTGVDYNPLRLERAAKLAPQVRFEIADLMLKPWPAEPFDIVLCSQVIEHIDDDVGFLKRLKMLVAHDGVLILGTPNEGCFTQRLRNRIHHESTDHCHFYTEKEIVRTLTAGGFKICGIRREVFFPVSDRLYYRLTSSDAGFRFLECCTKLCPSQCSDYYFECGHQ